MSDLDCMQIELTDPESESPGYYYGLRIIEYDTDNPEKIRNIVQRDYYHRTPLIEAIEDLLTFTQLSIDWEEQKILEELK